MDLRLLLKTLLQGVCLLLALPPALTTAFGRWNIPYTVWAHFFAQLPGLPGDYLRIAYYRLTLEQCPLDSRIQFGSFFVHPQTRVGHGVYIGGYCILGRTTIGDRTQIASGVQILSGARQHGRDVQGRIQGGDLQSFETIPIGADCWIGAGAIVMAPVGEQCTIGAGSVVTRPIPPHVTAVGAPARVLQQSV